jgi:hypothetical protein
LRLGVPSESRGRVPSHGLVSLVPRSGLVECQERRLAAAGPQTWAVSTCAVEQVSYSPAASCVSQPNARLGYRAFRYTVVVA